MFVTPAYAQAAGGAGATGDLFLNLAPILFLIIIFWFLIFRPQQKRMKEQRALLAGIRRGDTIVTSGGLVGKVTKVLDDSPDLEVEVAQGVKVKVVRAMVSDVRSKPEPVNDNT